MSLVLAVAIATGVAAALALGQVIVVPIISAGVSFGAVPVGAVLPLAPIIVFSWACHGGSPLEHGASVRQMHRFVAAFAGVVFAAFLLGLFGTTLVTGSSAAQLPIARNLAVYFMLWMLATIYLGYRDAALVPVCFLLVSALFGRWGGEVHPWAFVLVTDPPLIVVGAISLVLGALVFVIVGPRVSRGR